MTLSYILLATLAGGLVSVLLAALASLTALSRLASVLVSFSVGSMLAVALLDIVPEVSETLDPHRAGMWLLAGLFVFFALEKFTLWRHDHDELDPGHDPHHHPAGVMLMVGDTLHNFVDGVMIAAAFLQSPALGVTTAAAVILHEVPQEVGDFMVLLHSGYTRRRALLLNLFSGFAAVVGGVLGYFALDGMRDAVPYVLCLSAASFIYIAMADLVPELHKHRKTQDLVLQLGLAALGVLAIVALMHEH
ncbi:MAG: ZIP family metal transporter [Betaproteobacteria bacterium]|nr:ZIP family metal transporter [Betaproteobacteria bacterium]